MTKVAFAYSTRDRVGLTRKTLPPLLESGADVFWIDGSVTKGGIVLTQDYPVKEIHTIRGGSDIAIIFGLTRMLEHPEHYDFIGLQENDVLLETGWLPRLLNLFETVDVPVGAVSARNIKDRILFSLGDRAIMANLGGGNILFSREAAKIVLRNHRTWPTRDIRHVFLTMAGIDVAAPGATLFNLCGNVDDTVTYGSADFVWDPVLALHGYASMAPMPTMARNLDYLTLKYAEEETPSIQDSSFYVENLNKARLRPPSSLGAILTTTKRVWLISVQHFPSSMFFGNWTCRHECLRGFASHVFTSSDQGDLITINYVGTDCVFFFSGLDGAAVNVRWDNDEFTRFDLNLNLKAISAKRPYGQHQVVFVATKPGVEFFGAVFAERQAWFEPDKSFDFYSLPPISDALHRNDQIRMVLEAGAPISTEACI